MPFLRCGVELKLNVENSMTHAQSTIPKLKTTARGSAWQERFLYVELLFRDVVAE